VDLSTLGNRIAKVTMDDMTKWLLGALLGAVMLLIGMVSQSSTARIDATNADVAALRERSARNAERLMALETQYTEILRRLTTIDSKLP